MGYIICILSGIILGLFGSLLLIRKKLFKKSGDSGALSPDQFEKIKTILKHIEDGDRILEEIQELLEG